MGSAESKAARASGKGVVTHPQGKLKKLPEGVWGVLMTQRFNPGKKFATKHKTGIDDLLGRKDANVIDENMRAALLEEASGIMGWKLDEANQVVLRFQPQFNARGIAIWFCMNAFIQGDRKRQFYWIEYKDMAMGDPNYVPREVFTSKHMKPKKIKDPFKRHKVHGAHKPHKPYKMKTRKLKPRHGLGSHSFSSSSSSSSFGHSMSFSSFGHSSHSGLSVSSKSSHHFSH
eukprot:TRINITY_DN36936_c0_g1_i1.p1 TRINITY_DN36936_c0_g1~~TRINITY_DN36936_c0_g1_i1.p1  ORF type:complete len:230 (+),score=31.10 TRINITY_DN36936_c0_g1_i1:87-776(+)